VGGVIVKCEAPPLDIDLPRMSCLTCLNCPISDLFPLVRGKVIVGDPRKFDVECEVSLPVDSDIEY